MRTERKEKKERVQCTMFREAPEVLSIQEKAGCEISASESGDGKRGLSGDFPLSSVPFFGRPPRTFLEAAAVLAALKASTFPKAEKTASINGNEYLTFPVHFCAVGLSVPPNGATPRCARKPTPSHERE